MEKYGKKNEKYQLSKKYQQEVTHQQLEEARQVPSHRLQTRKPELSSRPGVGLAVAGVEIGRAHV